MTDLSPAAQAIKAAFDAEFGWSEALAAALRAAALHCKRDTLILLAIADELEQFAR